MTLSEFTYQLRLGVKLMSILVVLLTFFGLFFFLLFQIFNNQEVVETIKIDAKFGKIVKPVFEEALTTQPSLQYTLDTIDGNLPSGSSSAYVYFIPDKETKLGYLTTANQMAAAMGFITGQVIPTPIDDKTLKYVDAIKELTLNTNTYFFALHYLSTPTLQNLLEATPAANFTQLESDLSQKAKDFLSNQGLYFTWLARGKTNLVYQRYDLTNSQFVDIVADESAVGLKVDFFREDQDFPIVSPSYFSSQNYVILAPLNNSAQIVEAKVASFEKLELEPGIYPLLTMDEAWKRLVTGKASIISFDNKATKIKIKQIYIAYYDPETYQKYFQPVFVFLGDHDYVSYLPAITDAYFN